MTVDNGAPSAAGDLAQPVIAPQTDTQPGTDLAPEPVIDNQADPQNPEPEEDDDDLEFGYRKYKVKRSLKEGVENLRKEFTQSKQEQASRRAELEERETRIGEQLKADQEELGFRAQLHHVTSELKRFENFGWAQYQQLRQTDPAQADEAWAYKQHLGTLRGDLEGKIKTAETTRSQLAQSEATKRIEQTQEHARKIKGWKPEWDQQVVEFALNKGMSPHEVSRIMSPGFYDMVRDAMVGAAARKQQAAPSVPQTQPLDTVGARSNPGSRVDLATADMDAYVAARKAQIKAKQGR